jgi:NarL family two-component system response regulator LiaR
MAESIGILIVDDHPVVRNGLRAFLETQEGLAVVGEASDGARAAELAHELEPDVVLMDLVMPGVDGVAATRRIRELSPATKVIVLTSFDGDENVFPAIRAGAAGYLLKDVRPQELADAVRRVHAGEALLASSVAARLMQEVAETPAPTAALTQRELEVLREIARGLANKAIARELGVSEKTIKTHVSNILAKLHLTHRTQAALYAVREGLAELERGSSG